MSIYFGNDMINDLYIGLTPVSKGYVGTRLFYNGDNTIIDFTYEKYILNTQFRTLYNTAKKPVKSAILKGNTKYRDIDTGDILDTFDETKNLELASVKMPVLKTTRKNLISNWYNGEYIDDTGTLINKGGQVGTDFITIPTQGDYVCEDLKNGTVRFFDSNKQLIEKKSPINKSFNVPTGVKYVTFNYYSETYPSNLQLEKGTKSTPYEPYKSNTLTVNEDVELHGVGEVKDEFDLLTGEVTQRIGEVVFDGSEDWVQSGMADPRIFYISINDMAHKEDYRNSISCDKFVTCIGEGYLTDSTLLNGITGYIDSTDTYPNENWLYIKLADSEGSVEKLKQWLSQNPITVQYELTTESLKTVDLSVVDQDGNDTELSTFNDITHVTLSSEGLIPEAELEVATKNEEVLNTMSLEMDDISTTQTTLEETSNTQSENIDATMLATTEVYEQLL